MCAERCGTAVCIIKTCRRMSQVALGNFRKQELPVCDRFQSIDVFPFFFVMLRGEINVSQEFCENVPCNADYFRRPQCFMSLGSKCRWEIPSTTPSKCRDTHSYPLLCAAVFLVVLATALSRRPSNLSPCMLLFIS